MTALLAAAVADNVQWCQTVCRVHGISARIDSGVWFIDAPAPPFYPDAITIERAATSARVEHVLGGRRPASVKDSYAQLDLSGSGFESLFSATWIGLDPKHEVDAGATQWEAVSTVTALAEWSAAHGDTDVFRPSLLAEPTVLFLGLRERGRIVAGAIANLGDATIGLSNVFSCGPPDRLWERIVAESHTRFPGRPIVGYERDDDLAVARAAGFTELGPLRVWARAGEKTHVSSPLSRSTSAGRSK